MQARIDAVRRRVFPAGGTEDPCRVGRNPGFGKGDQLGTRLAGLLDQRHGLFDRAVEVEEYGRRLNRRGGVFFQSFIFCHFVFLLVFYCGGLAMKCPFSQQQ